MNIQLPRTLGIVVVCLVASTVIARAGALDGTKWKIKVTPDKDAAAKGEKEFDDELVFDDGKMTATACLPSGFHASKYTAQEEGDVIKWKTVQVSRSEGNAYWKGEAKGNTITGTDVWTKADGTKLRATFTGTKQ